MFSALYDTGAAPNCIREDVFMQAKVHGLVVRKIGVHFAKSAQGLPLPTPGTFQIKVNIMGRAYEGPFMVVPSLSSDIILGMKAASDLNLDYSVSKKTFSFGEKPLAVAPVEMAQAARIAPGKTSRVKLRASFMEKPICNMDILTNINQCNVLVRTNDVGEFHVIMANPSPVPIEIPRKKTLGYATHNSALEYVSDIAAVGHQRNTNAVLDRAKHADLETIITMATKHLQSPLREHMAQTLRNNWQAISTNKFDLGKTELLQHKITLSDTTPTFHKQFPIPLHHAPVIKEHVDKWLQMGIVEPARSPYNSPIFCVKKKGEGGFRLCLDYRAVNEKSLPENYTIRTPEDCMAEIGQAGARYFIALDLSSGFYQMPLHPDSRPITAFTVPHHGQLQWTRGAMGLRGCPGSFARLMDMALRGIKNVITYIDDVLIYAKTPHEAMATLNQVLQRLAAHNLKINAAKSSFLQTETEYLGHTLSTAGIKPGKDKTLALRNAHPPTSVKQLKSFLGTTNYFRNFVKHYAHRAGKLYALTRKDSTWKGGNLPPEALKTFFILRNLIANASPEPFPSKTADITCTWTGPRGTSNKKGG